MKEKVLVRVKLPMADMAFDVRIPYDISVAVAAKMIAKMFKQITREDLPISKEPILLKAPIGELIDGTKTIRESGITDSDLLLLI